MTEHMIHRIFPLENFLRQWRVHIRVSHKVVELGEPNLFETVENRANETFITRHPNTSSKQLHNERHWQRPMIENRWTKESLQREQRKPKGNTRQIVQNPKNGLIEIEIPDVITECVVFQSIR
jgi:hypothetical protein